MAISIKKITDEIDTLIPMPYVINRLIRLLEDPEVSTNKISDVISKDEALTAKILKVVNSAYFGIKNPIVNISRATVILGFQNIKNIAIGVSLIATNEEFPSTMLNRVEFWKHQLGTAAFSQQVVKALGYKVNSEEIFLCSFLHDIGKLAMINMLKGKYDEAIKVSMERQLPIYKVERELFGFDHPQVGYELLRKWNFPGNFTEAISRHHKPLALYKNAITEQEQLEASIIIANMLANLCALGSSGDYIVDTGQLEPELITKILPKVPDANKLFYQTVKIFELIQTIRIPDVNVHVCVSLIDKKLESILKVIFMTNQYNVIPVENFEKIANKHGKLIFIHDDVTEAKLTLDPMMTVVRIKKIPIQEWKNISSEKTMNTHTFLAWFNKAAK